MTSTIYQPLDSDRREIRLLHLEGSTDPDSIIDCSLNNVSLDAKPRYEAISYCWGEVTGIEIIRLNGIKFEAPASAAKVLRQFRPTSGSKTFWIDALCINQTNIEERSSQVSFMDQVYANTERCLIWLGDSDERTQSVFRTLKIISDEYYPQLHEATNGFTANEPHKLESADYFEIVFSDCSARDVVEFFQRSWFSRVWVQQEAILAPAVECRCGGLEVLWRDVSRASRWLVYEWARFTERFELDGVFGAAGMVLLFQEPELSKVTGLELSTVLNGTRYLEAADARDKVYGVLGLAAQPEETKEFMGWFQVDYEKPISSVFTDATLSSSICQATLTALEYVEIVRFETRILDGAFPSWVLRLDRKFQGILRLRFGTDCFCCPLPLDLPTLASCADRPYVKLKGYTVNHVSRVLVENTPDVSDIEGVGRMIDAGMKARTGDEGKKAGSYLLDCLTVGKQANVLISLTTEECSQAVAILSKICSTGTHEVEGFDETLDWLLAMYKEEWVELRAATGGTLGPLLKELLYFASMVCPNRCLFLASDGNIGLGHPSVQENDCIAALAGSKYLCILRPYIPPRGNGDHSKGVYGTAYQFVGLAYMPGLMNGEIVGIKQEANEEQKFFEIW